MRLNVGRLKTEKRKVLLHAARNYKLWCLLPYGIKDGHPLWMALKGKFMEDTAISGYLSLPPIVGDNSSSKLLEGTVMALH